MSEVRADQSRRVAVLGSPIAHSLSPAMHRAAYRQLGLTGWQYDAIEVTEAQLPELMAQLGPSWAGLSVTMPLKHAVCAHLTELGELATAVGAVNTVIPAAGSGWRGENTDVYGIVTAVNKALGVPITGVTIIGAGGTAAAVVAAAAQWSVSSVTVLARDLSRVEGLAAAADRLGVELIAQHLTPDAVAERAGEKAAEDAQVLVSTLPPGAADEYATKLPDGNAFIQGPPLLDVVYDPLLLDVVYDPWPTALAALWPGPVVSGLEMLVHQAVAQVQLMTGQSVAAEVLRRAAYAEQTARSARLSRGSLRKPR